MDAFALPFLAMSFPRLDQSKLVLVVLITIFIKFPVDLIFDPVLTAGNQSDQILVKLEHIESSLAKETQGKEDPPSQETPNPLATGFKFFLLMGMVSLFWFARPNKKDGETRNDSPALGVDVPGDKGDDLLKDHGRILIELDSRGRYFLIGKDGERIRLGQSVR